MSQRNEIPDIDIHELQNYKEKVVTLSFIDLEIKLLWTQEQIETFAKNLLGASLHK